jgi:hypothetical protein
VQSHAETASDQGGKHPSFDAALLALGSAAFEKAIITHAADP